MTAHVLNRHLNIIQILIATDAEFTGAGMEIEAGSSSSIIYYQA